MSSGAGTEGQPEDEGKFPEAGLIQHVFDLAQQVAMALGEADNPVTGQREQNLPAARYVIDVIEMLERLTRGNRSDEEDQYLTGLLSNLKLTYVSKSK